MEDASIEGPVYLLRVKAGDGRVHDITVEPSELEQALSSSEEAQQPLVSSSDFFLLMESARIRHAYAFDPYFAVTVSGIEALPHQLEAVYERLLPQPRLRFLLADDPGAGKTIMTGLLMKELKLREVIENVLIICPAPLTIQWQDELRSKFDEVFEVIGPELAKNQLAGNAWERFRQCITSMDFAKQLDVLPGILRSSWDLVVIDEAHKCSARTYGKEVKKTLRYQMAEQLSAHADRLLLLTATPHQGTVDQFEHFLRLLDEDQFVNQDLNRRLLQVDNCPWFIRRLKEDLHDFDGKRLFTERHPVTIPFELSPPEHTLYDAVTNYINTFLPRQHRGRRKMSVALARTVFQRRLASSLRAIRRSLENRRDRLRGYVEEVESLPHTEQEARLKALSLLPEDDEQESDDLDDRSSDEIVSGVTVAERLDDLRSEVAELDRLATLAQRTEGEGEETKLSALRDCLHRSEFNELKDGRGKLLIFTEHRDTLNYLKENLQKWGYTTCEIHGGMNALQRKEAQEVFQRDVQVCVATEAAGEGINLQFCHLMVNYDIPWNPNRLEQRMGRIHRIKQEFDVYIFNFVARNTVEGEILETLLAKLDEIRRDLKGRVFDVIGPLLRLNDVNLEEMLREAAYNPRHIEDYKDQIRQMSPERLNQFEKQAGVALATTKVDFSRVRPKDLRSEERRLMPEYVEAFFLQAAQEVGLRVEVRADGLYRVEHVPERLRSHTLGSAKRYGPPLVSYRKLTFHKEHLNKAEHADAQLVSPGHPLFAAVVEVLEQKLSSAKQAAAVFVDPTTDGPYAVHFFEVMTYGESPQQGNEPVLVDAALSVILEDAGGRLEVAAPDLLHDFTQVGADAPKHTPEGIVLVNVERQQALDRWIRANVQHAMVQRKREERDREIGIRREYLALSFDASITAARRKWLDLCAKVAAGEEPFKLARDNALKETQELETRKVQKIKELAHLAVLRQGPALYLGTAFVVPPEDERVGSLMRRDEEVEARAIETVLSYERMQGREPTRVDLLKDGSGFDIRSVGTLGTGGQREVRRIEVKGRAGETGDVVLSKNEWVQAHRHGPSYWLYVVTGCKAEGGPKPPIMIQDPARTLAVQVQEMKVVKGYLVPWDALSALQKGET